VQTIGYAESQERNGIYQKKGKVPGVCGFVISGGPDKHKPG
jgi:hypothetical protein